jgi:hypothetical protein
MDFFSIMENEMSDLVCNREPLSRLRLLLRYPNDRLATLSHKEPEISLLKFVATMRAPSILAIFSIGTGGDTTFAFRRMLSTSRLTRAYPARNPESEFCGKENGLAAMRAVWPAEDWSSL